MPGRYRRPRSMVRVQAVSIPRPVLLQRLLCSQAPVLDIKYGPRRSVCAREIRATRPFLGNLWKRIVTS